ncbi:hypothetical protein FIC_00822 [Flavobacteriaceae bacterium 3519-10]|nr:hypothetical protein FIC_00822 [Flavobacteriaceae bacterium 3519-10]
MPASGKLLKNIGRIAEGCSDQNLLGDRLVFRLHVVVCAAFLSFCKSNDYHPVLKFQILNIS